MYTGTYEGGYSLVADDVWSKLYAYLLFREECGGKWINSGPRSWYEYIVNDMYKINIKESIDDGGGLSSFRIEVINGADKSVFEISMQRWIYHDNSEFYKTMGRAYEYMSRHSHLRNDRKTPFNVSERYSKDSKIDNIRWCQEFEIDKDIEKLPIIDNKENFNTDLLSFASEGFRFLSEIGDFKDCLKITNSQLEKEVYTAKQWAIFALIEMQRYYVHAC